MFIDLTYFKITIFQITFFLLKNAHAGKFTHGKKVLLIFYFPGKIFLCFTNVTSRNQIFHKGKTLVFRIYFSYILIFHPYISCLSTMESSPSTIESSPNTIESSPNTIESFQSTMKSSQSRIEDGTGKNRRKRSDYACFGSWWIQIGSRSRRWDLSRLIVWI